MPVKLYVCQRSHYIGENLSVGLMIYKEKQTIFFASFRNHVSKTSHQTIILTLLHSVKRNIALHYCQLYHFKLFSNHKILFR